MIWNTTAFLKALSKCFENQPGSEYETPNIFLFKGTFYQVVIDA